MIQHKQNKKSSPHKKIKKLVLNNVDKNRNYPNISDLIYDPYANTLKIFKLRKSSFDNKSKHASPRKNIRNKIKKSNLVNSLVAAHSTENRNEDFSNSKRFKFSPMSNKEDKSIKKESASKILESLEVLRNLKINSEKIRNNKREKSVKRDNGKTNTLKVKEEEPYEKILRDNRNKIKSLKMLEGEIKQEEQKEQVQNPQIDYFNESPIHSVRSDMSRRKQRFEDIESRARKREKIKCRFPFCCF